MIETSARSERFSNRSMSIACCAAIQDVAAAVIQTSRCATPVTHHTTPYGGTPGAVMGEPGLMSGGRGATS